MCSAQTYNIHRNGADSPTAVSSGTSAFCSAWCNLSNVYRTLLIGGVHYLFLLGCVTVCKIGITDKERPRPIKNFLSWWNLEISFNQNETQYKNLGNPSKKNNFQTLDIVQTMGGEVWARTNFFPICMFGHIFNGEGGQNPLSKVDFEKKFVLLLL